MGFDVVQTNNVTESKYGETVWVRRGIFDDGRIIDVSKKGGLKLRISQYDRGINLSKQAEPFLAVHMLCTV